MRLKAQSVLNLDHAGRNPLSGLQIPELYLTECADIGAVLVSAATDAADVTKALAVALGCEVPQQHGAISKTGGRRVIWMSPRAWLVLCAPLEEAVLCTAVATEFPDRLAHATRFSDYLCWFELAGSNVQSALKQGSFISFADGGLVPGHAKRTPVAGIPAVILRETETTWTIGVERSRAQFFVDWLRGLTHSSLGSGPVNPTPLALFSQNIRGLVRADDSYSIFKRAKALR